MGEGLEMTGSRVQADLCATLPDGTQVGYAEFGAPDAQPLMDLHGSPACRLQPLTVSSGAVQAAENLGLHVFAPDRPGVGLSPFRRYTVADYPEHVAGLADALGLAEFAVLGGSGGGKFACACAWRLGGRVTRLVLAASTASFDLPGAKAAFAKSDQRVYTLADKAPWLLRLVFAKIARDARRGDLDSLSSALTVGPRDRELLAEEEFRRRFARLLVETFRQGARGATYDYSLEARPWHVPLHEIQVPTHIWHGEDDPLVPPVESRILAEALPTAITHFVPGEEHLSLAVDRGEEILRSTLTD